MESLFGTLSQEQFRKFLKQAKTVADVVTLLEEADTSPSSR
jgi:mannitol/fructose-specific phosphotransferase system IIA component (Ntr-type)